MSQKIDELFKIPMPKPISKEQEIKIAKIWNKKKSKEFN